MTFAERSADDREVLAEDKNLPTVDGAVAGDDAVAGMGVTAADRGAAADLENIDFFEGPFVEQQMQAFPGRQFASQVLNVDALRPAAGQGLLAQFKKLENITVHDLNHELLLRCKLHVHQGGRR